MTCIFRIDDGGNGKNVVYLIQDESPKITEYPQGTTITFVGDCEFVHQVNAEMTSENHNWYLPERFRAYVAFDIMTRRFSLQNLESVLAVVDKFDPDLPKPGKPVDKPASEDAGAGAHQ